MIQLSGLDIFFISTTVISLVINITQYLEINPIYNSLCGLMNDCRIKAKYYQESVTKNDDINKKIVTDIDGFGQQIYGILKTIRQKDKAFCAYSITEKTKFNKE